MKIKKGETGGVIFVSIVVVIVLLIIYSTIGIWALNVVFSLGLEYTFKNIFAVGALLFLMRVK